MVDQQKQAYTLLGRSTHVGDEQGVGVGGQVGLPSPIGLHGSTYEALTGAVSKTSLVTVVHVVQYTRILHPNVQILYTR